MKSFTLVWYQISKAESHDKDEKHPSRAFQVLSPKNLLVF